MSPEQKRRLEELRQLAIQIERLYGNRETVLSPAGKAAYYGTYELASVSVGSE
jgi:hypothetical protein